MRRFILTLAAISFAYGCAEQDHTLEACRVVQESPVLAGDPGTISLQITGKSTTGLSVTAKAGEATVTAAAPIRDGKVAVEFPRLPTGSVTFSASDSVHTVACAGELTAAPFYPESTTAEEIRGIDLVATAGDIDGDGSLDLIVSNGYAYFNDGNGAFRATRLFSEETDRVALAQIDGVHGLDIVAWNRRGGRSIAKGTVLLSDGKGGFQESPALKSKFLTGNYGDAAIYDWDQDGYADTVTVAESGLWHRKNVEGTLSSPVRVDPALGSEVRGFGTGDTEGEYVSVVEPADYNEDGRPDIVYGRLAVALQQADGTFDVQAELFSLTLDCGGFGESTLCARIVDFVPLGPGRLLMSVARGMNQFFHDLSPVAQSDQGTWFAKADTNFDGVEDLVGFGISSSIRGVAFLGDDESDLGLAGPIDPYFAEDGPGNVIAFESGTFDKRVGGPQFLAVSANGKLVLYRAERP